MHADAVVLNPEIPAAVPVRLVHASDDGSIRAGLREVHPGGNRERLRAIEVAHVLEFDRVAGADRECLLLLLAFHGPIVSFVELHEAILAVHLERRAVAGALVERCMEHEPGGGQAILEVLGLGRLQPLLVIDLGGQFTRLQLCLGGGEFLRQRFEPRAVLAFRHGNDRRRVLHVPVHCRLRGVVEERGHAVEIALRDRIELVVVADRTTRREPHPHLIHGLGAIARVQHEVLFVDRAAFARGDVAAVEPRGDELIERRVR